MPPLPTDPAPNDITLLKSALRQNLLSSEQVATVLREAPAGQFAETILAKGWVRPDAIEKLKRGPENAPSQDAGLPPEVQAAMRDPDRRFGEFVLVSLLGKGGMGEVWRAWQLALGRMVALKRMSGTSAGDEARFRREAQIIASLQHPNVPAVYEFGVLSGRFFIAMQIIEGRTLAGAKVPVRRSLEIIRDAAEALHAAHARGIVHRDVKPHNLMLDESGKLFVMDFGLARADAGSSADRGLTVSGDLLGTPSYMSPEQAWGKSYAVGPATDVWSLGVTLYELVTGQLPFKGRHYSEVLDAIRTADPARPGSIADGVSLDVETIILHCLRKEPGKRYASAAELASDIAAVLRGEAIKARPVGQWERAGRRLVRYPAMYAAVFFALLTAGVYAALLHDTAATDFNEDLRQARLAQLGGRSDRVDEILSRNDATKGYRRQEVAEARAITFRRLDCEAAYRWATEDGSLTSAERVALLTLAVTLGRKSEAREPLRELLGRGSFADRLLHAWGFHRLRITTDPPGATIRSWPEAKFPEVANARYAIRVEAPGRGSAWLYVPWSGLLDAEFLVKLPDRPAPESYEFVSDGAGGGLYFSMRYIRAGASIDAPPRLFSSREEASAEAVRLGGRLPTHSELAVLDAIGSAGVAGDIPGNPMEWTLISEFPVSSWLYEAARPEPAAARLVREAP